MQLDPLIVKVLLSKTGKVTLSCNDCWYFKKPKKLVLALGKWVKLFFLPVI